MHAKITLKQLKKEIDDGLTRHEIAAKYKCCLSTIDKRCARAGFPQPVLAPHHRTRTVTFNTRFFRNIDTESKAYTLGFIAADGGRDRNWGIKIGLHPKDADILHKIAKAMDCSYVPKLVENNTRVRLTFYDIDTVQDLERYGIIERKTFTLPFAQNVPEDMLRHYLRGIFDGDGSVGKQARLVTGSEPFYRGFLAWYEKRYGRLPWHKQEGNKFRLVFNRPDGVFIRWMYDNAAIVLDRKNKLFFRNWSEL